jgi:Bacterial regulatory helix-turn-helix protein, lysR family
MIDLDLDLLRCFVSVVETGSFTLAAKRMHLFWKTDPSLDTRDIQPFQIEFPVTSPEPDHYF